MQNVGLIAVASLALLGEPNASRPRFAASDVQVFDVHSLQQGAFRVRQLSSDRYQIRNATMVDLIRTAYSVDADDVVSTLSWLAQDRFDIAAKLPADTAADGQKLMLQALLEDRFGLVVHRGSKPVTGYVLKVTRKFAPKRSAGAGQGGCSQQASNAVGVGLPITYRCRDVTMKSFADGMPGMVGTNLEKINVTDATGLQGGWDFDITWTVIVNGIVGDSSVTHPATIFDAAAKLGFALEKTSVSKPALIVDRINRVPTANSPDLAKSVPPIPDPARFELASVKASTPLRSGPPLKFQRNQVTIRGVPMKSLLEFAFRDRRKTLHTWMDGMPGWAEFDSHYDIQAQTAAGTAWLDEDNVGPPLLALLKDRFGLAYHMEQRPKNAYRLEANGPKLRKPDTRARAACEYSPAPAKAPGGSQMLSCRNVTMPQFADWLTGHAMGVKYGPVSDATGITGAWDLSMTFSLTGFGPPSDDPVGGYDMFDAFRKQLGLTLRKVDQVQSVIVIDHVNRQPTGN